MSGSPLDRAWIGVNLPQRGSMSLLDEIVRWDATTLHALARRHRAPDHPLRRGTELPIAAGIEYGAQAAAAHGALAAGRASTGGFLASVRSVVFHARRLDDVAPSLDIVAEQLGADESVAMYRFAVSAAGATLVEGRIAVAFPK